MTTLSNDQINILKSQIAHVNAKWCGAVGDSTPGALGTDDTSALNSAFDLAASLGLPLYIPTGGYNVTDAIHDGFGSSTPDGVEIIGDGPGKTILYHNNPGGLLLRPYGGGITATASAARLTSAADTLDQILTVDDTTGMAAGDYLYVQEQDAGALIVHPSLPSTKWLVSEVVRIRSVDSSTQVTLEGRLENAYSNMSYARRLTNPVEGFAIRNLTIRNAVSGGGGAYQNAIGAFYIKNFIVENVTIGGLDDDGIVMQYCIDFRISNLTVDDLDNAAGFTPYGIIVSSGCWRGLVENGNAKNGRHFITSGGNPETNPNCAYIDVVNCKGSGQANAFDTHTAGHNWKFINCTATAGADSPAGGGFQIRNRNSQIIDSTAIACRLGYYLVNGLNNQVINSIARNCDVGFKRVRTANGGFSHCLADHPATSGFVFDEEGYSGNYGGRLHMCEVQGDPSGYAFDFQTWDDGEDFLRDDLKAFDAANKFNGIPHGRLYGFDTLENMKFATMPRSEATGAVILPSGSGFMNGFAITLRKGEVISSIGFVPTVLPLTQSHLWFALYDKDGNLLGQTADRGASKLTNATLNKLPLTSPATPAYTGIYYVAISSVHTGSPQYRGKALGGGDVSNGPPALCGRSGTTGLTTTAPASSGVFYGNANFAFACVD